MAGSNGGASGLSPDAGLAQRILDALAGLHFGSVEIVVHNSQVVQIERREKVRLDAPSTRSAGPQGR
ncbi:MAG: YezD family protein [Candidatus Eisenbacteria bacterium]